EGCPFGQRDTLFPIPPAHWRPAKKGREPALQVFHFSQWFPASECIHHLNNLLSFLRNCLFRCSAATRPTCTKHAGRYFLFYAARCWRRACCGTELNSRTSS